MTSRSLDVRVGLGVGALEDQGKCDYLKELIAGFPDAVAGAGGCGIGVGGIRGLINAGNEGAGLGGGFKELAEVGKRGPGRGAVLGD